MDWTYAVLLLKVLTLPVIGLLVLAVVYTFFYGRRAVGRRGLPSRKTAIERHKNGPQWMLRLTNILIGLIVVLEVLPHTRTSGWYPAPLVWVHAAVAMGYYGIFLAMKWRYTGERYPNLHWKLAYGGIATTFVFILMTGAIMYPYL